MYSLSLKSLEIKLETDSLWPEHSIMWYIMLCFGSYGFVTKYGRWNCYDFVTKTGSYKISTGFCDKTLYTVYLPAFVIKPYM